jgi:hypothetical protein
MSNPAKPPQPSTDSPNQETPMSPGDEAPAGTKGTGETICPRCGGTGRLDNQACPNCAGTGRVTHIIGGA